MEIKKTYIYANSQILAQHNGSYSAPIYFYLHDRLGSVRLLINSASSVVNSYTYNPFGEMFPTECNETVSNPFKFTGQFFDDETGQYYLRARQYDPYIGRFTSRDPLDGKFEESLSLHKYLYCQNESINQADPWGLFGFAMAFYDMFDPGGPGKANAADFENAADDFLLHAGIYDIQDIEFYLRIMSQILPIDEVYIYDH